MAPAVKAVLPPASSRGARSRTVTDAPCSAAETAAAKAALPAPTTMTSGIHPPKPACATSLGRPPTAPKPVDGAACLHPKMAPMSIPAELADVVGEIDFDP